MNFTDAKNTLLGVYLNYDFELVEDRADGIKLKHADCQHDIEIDSVIINEYIAEADLLQGAKRAPTETSILTPGYREQRIVVADRGQGFLGERRIIVGDAEGRDPIVEVSRASSAWRTFFRVSKEDIPFALSRVGQSQFQSFRRVYEGYLTIKVSNLPEMGETALIDLSNDIIESALFDISYTTGLTFEVAPKWPPNNTQTAAERTNTENISLPPPRCRYHPELSKFYRRASSPDPYIQFLSYYHVAEYFFVKVADEMLYRRLGAIMNDPQFRAKERHMDRIIQTVIDHRKEGNEQEMLKSVLVEYVDELELIREMAAIEANSQQKLYTTKTRCFGYDLERISLQKGHVFGALATRIKTIRNALIHSSDRHERKDRYVPGPEANLTLRREIPLMKFLAERIIIATATAI